MGRTAIFVCTLITTLLIWSACAWEAQPPPAASGSSRAPDSIWIYTADPADPAGAKERQCAWFGDVHDGVLYFGQAAFWSSYRAVRPAADETAGSDGATASLADLNTTGPQLVGRFDLQREAFLPSLDVATGDPAADRSGVWDVLAHPSGRVYFTTFFESAGYVDLESGVTKRFTDAGTGLNELALGPDGGILASRYAAAQGSAGSVVLLDAEGRLVWEHRLPAPEGFQFAPKTVAFDPVRREIWVTTDLLPGSAQHPAFVLDLEGRELRRLEEVELHFVHFEPDGKGYAAVVDGSRLFLKQLSASPEAHSLETARTVLLDEDFPTAFDFVQDIQVTEDGRAVVTRWSGLIHVVAPADDGGEEPVETLQLPFIESDGLYYSAFLSAGSQRGRSSERLCATYCAGITVVCAPLPGLLR